MKTRPDKNLEGFLMSGNPEPITFLQYQIVYFYKGKEKYLKSFNILKDNKLIKKFYLKKMMLFDEKSDIQLIIMNNIFSEILNVEHKSDDRNTTSNKKKTETPKPNADARARAAANLFSEMGL